MRVELLILLDKIELRHRNSRLKGKLNNFSIEWKTKKSQFYSNSTCWKKERFTILHDCHPCPDEGEGTTQKKSGVCIHTNYMEVIQCQSSGYIVARSCDNAALNQQKDFITFEVSMFVTGTLAFLVSYIRLRMLNRRTHLKIEKQLAAKGWGWNVSNLPQIILFVVSVNKFVFLKILFERRYPVNKVKL